MRSHYTLFLITIIFVFLSHIGIAQSISSLKEMADIQFVLGKYQEAHEKYLKVQIAKPNKLEIKYKLGVCYFYLGNYHNAEQYLLFTANEKGGNQEAWYYLGRLYHYQSKYKDAINYYKRFLKEIDPSHVKRSKAKHLMRQCASARELKYLTEIAIVENLGNKVNDVYDDYAPILSPSRKTTLYFASEKVTNIGGLRDKEGLQDEYLGTYNSDIFSSQLINGEWTSVRSLDHLINSQRDDEILGFSSDATVMYYYKGYHSKRDGAIFTDTIRASEEIIFPKELSSPIRLKEGDTSPFFFNDSIIIYAANKPDGYGGLDLYVTKRLQGKFWTRPQNLGPEVNSPYDEKHPFLAKDGRTIYFSSNRVNSLGGFDIFKSYFTDSDLKWSEAENLGLPINSPGDDLYFKMGREGLKAYFASDRFGGRGGLDIYSAYYKLAQKEQLIVSNPVCFYLVNDDNKNNTTASIEGNSSDKPTTINPLPEEKKKKVYLSQLFYQGEQVLTSSNIGELNKVIKLAEENPLTKVEITGHTDIADPEKFRLYFSYLKAEKAATYLRNNGLTTDRVIVKGLGSNYPLVKNKNPDGSTSTIAVRLNKRIDIRILYLDDNSTTEVVYKLPEISDKIKEYKSAYYEGSLKGLSYKVQVAALKSIYDSDIIIKYKDSMVEEVLNKNLLRYTVGLFRTYSSAKYLKEELIKNGVSGAYIVPYIDGVRLAPSAAAAYSAKYPDLKNFASGK